MIRPSLLVATALAMLAFPASLALDQQLDGVNYDLRQGPDWDPKKCKTADTIASELKVLKTITSKVRTYSLADCDVSPVLTEAKKLEMTVWLGVWVSDDKKVFDKEVKTLESLINKAMIDENVVGFNVGSEAVYREDISPKQAIEYLTEFRDVLKKHTLTTPVSITEIGDILIKYPEIVEASDIVTANAFPFWEKTDAGKAAPHFHKRIQPLLKIAGKKEVIITETGWPTAGVSPNASEASPENAARYMNDFYAIAKAEKWKYYYFQAFDSPYKALQSKNENDVEGNFGIFTADGTMKPAYTALKFSPLAESAEEASSSGSSASAVKSKNSTSTAGSAGAGGAGTVKAAGGSKAGAPAGASKNTGASPAPSKANSAVHIISGLGACAAVAASVVLNL
ncbi:TPA: hypothetical protein N0F65_002030 [Lagenidium giganteum]|uniref:glucan endo-1,3-beta-D-glucosidase n=1 Tax=Lagenidium giganteum TaxID=4803 RepID=A0AAV2Z3I1_9STRA|nr:TPA: hypothetical protein N0F65_002030 [Lagenidium giganteum]